MEYHNFPQQYHYERSEDYLVDNEWMWLKKTELQEYCVELTYWILCFVV